MTLHFINATLIDPENGTETTGSLTVEDGRIAAVTAGGLANPKGEIVDCRGKYLAPGIVDLGVKVCEPGERHKESYPPRHPPCHRQPRGAGVRHPPRQ